MTREFSLQFEMSGLVFPFLFLSFPFLSGLSRPKRPGQARPGQERPKRPGGRPPALRVPGGEGFTRLIRMGLRWKIPPSRSLGQKGQAAEVVRVGRELVGNWSELQQSWSELVGVGRELGGAGWRCAFLRVL